MQELIAGLGLPAQIAALVWAAFGGVLLYRNLKNGKNGKNGNGDTALAAEVRMADAVKEVLERLDRHHGELMENLDKTRHDLRGLITDYLWGTKRPKGDG